MCTHTCFMAGPARTESTSTSNRGSRRIDSCTGLRRGYIKSDFTLDEGKGQLNPFRGKKEGYEHRRRKMEDYFFLLECNSYFDIPPVLLPPLRAHVYCMTKGVDWRLEYGWNGNTHMIYNSPNEPNYQTQSPISHISLSVSARARRQPTCQCFRENYLATILCSCFAALPITTKKRAVRRENERFSSYHLHAIAQHLGHGELLVVESVSSWRVCSNLPSLAPANQKVHVDSRGQGVCVYTG